MSGLWNGGHHESDHDDDDVVGVRESLEAGDVWTVDDGRVEWLVEGLYDDGGELTPRRVLLVDKPVLVLRADDGSEARFAVTRQLADQLGLVFADCSRAFRGAPTVRGGLLRLREVDDRPLRVRVREFFRVRPLRAWGGFLCGVFLLALFARILVSAM